MIYLAKWLSEFALNTEFSESFDHFEFLCGFERVLWNNCFWCEFLVCYKLPTCYGRLQKLSFKSSKRAWRVLCCSFSRGETWCYVVACLGKNVFSEKKIRCYVIINKQETPQKMRLYLKIIEGILLVIEVIFKLGWHLFQIKSQVIQEDFVLVKRSWRIVITQNQYFTGFTLGSSTKVSHFHTKM